MSITGPRQSGKTTLLKQIFPEHEYANLENSLTRQFARDNPFRFLQQGKHGIVIDEAQHLHELFFYIQVHVDETRRNGEIILTGSQNFLLMEKITQSLAGRVAIFNLLPFSVRELEGTVYEEKDAFQYIFKGLFPRVHDQQVPPAANATARSKCPSPCISTLTFRRICCWGWGVAGIARPIFRKWFCLFLESRVQVDNWFNNLYVVLPRTKIVYCNGSKIHTGA